MRSYYVIIKNIMQSSHTKRKLDVTSNDSDASSTTSTSANHKSKKLKEDIGEKSTTGEDLCVNLIVSEWKTSSATTPRVILRCPRVDCNFLTRESGFTMTTARKKLFQHMCKDDSCNLLVDVCPACKQYKYIKTTEFHLLSKHQTQGGCNKLQNVQSAIDGRALTISDNTSFSTSAIFDRYKASRNTVQNLLPDDGLTMTSDPFDGEDDLYCQPIMENVATKKYKPTSREMLQYIATANSQDLTFSTHDPRVNEYMSTIRQTNNCNVEEEIIYCSSNDYDERSNNDDESISSKSDPENVSIAEVNQHKSLPSFTIDEPEIIQPATQIPTNNDTSHNDPAEIRNPTTSSETDDVASANTSIFDTGVYLLKHRYSSQTNPFSKQELAYISLLKILDRPDIPLCVFDDVSKWVRENHDNIKSTKTITRNSITTTIQNTIHGDMKHRLLPKIVPTTLPSGSQLGVPVMDFEYMMANTLINDELMRQENLLVNLQDPFTKRTNTSNEYGDIDTGSWYDKTFDKRCTDSSQDVLMSLIQFIDGTVIDKLGKQSLEPVATTLGIFNRNTRYKHESWFTTGCIENAANIYKFLGGDKIDPTQKAEDYHHILKIIMEPIRKIQRQGGFEFFLPKKEFCDIKSLPSKQSCGDWTKVRFKLVIQFIIGDTEGFNKLCLKMGSHNTKYLCRDCNVLTKDGAVSSHVCELRNLKNMVEAYNDNKLNDQSFVQLFNSFWLLDFGENDGNIYQATLNEILHMLHAGVLVHTYVEIQNLFSPTIWKIIERIAQSMAKEISRQTESTNFPPVRCFVRGLNPGTSMTAKEKLGRMFLLYLVLSRDDVTRLVLSKGSKPGFPEMKMEYYLSIIHLLERLLGSHAWMHASKHDKRIVDPPSPGEDSISQDAMRRLMDQIVNVLPRVRINTTNVVRHKKNIDEVLFSGSKADCQNWIKDHLKLGLGLVYDEFVIKKQHQVSANGNAWNIPKLHALLHIVEMVSKHGVMANSNGGPCESHFRLNLKKPAKTTQRRNATFACDTLKSYGRQFAQSQAYRYLPQYIIDIDKNKRLKSVGGSSYEIGYDAIKKECVSRWISKRMKNRELVYPKATLKYISQRFFTNLHQDGGVLDSRDTIKCFTEATINGNTIRAHPNYQGEGEFFDWISVQYENLDEPAVGRVFMILDLRSANFLTRDFLQSKYGNKYLPSSERIEKEIYLMMKFSDDDQPVSLGHCYQNKKLRLMKRYNIDKESKYDLVPLTGFNAKELVFKDLPCVAFVEEERIAQKKNQRIRRNGHIENLNRILPVTEWVDASFVSNPLPAETKQNSKDGTIPYYLHHIDTDNEEIAFVLNSKNEMTSSKRGTKITNEV